MNTQLICAVAEKLKGFPLYSQEKTNGNPLLAAKLFNASGQGTWWLTEYDPDQRIAFGYVSLFENEWGYVSLDELAALRLGNWYCIELDRYFEPCRFKDLKLPD